MVDVVGKDSWKEHEVGKSAGGQFLLKLERIDGSWEVSTEVGKLSWIWKVKLKFESFGCS